MTTEYQWYFNVIIFSGTYINWKMYGNFVFTQTPLQEKSSFFNYLYKMTMIMWYVYNLLFGYNNNSFV